jgi:hypothetical protein
MQLAAPAVERGEPHAQTDIDAPALHARAGIPSFAPLLANAGPRDRQGLVGIWRADAQYHLYVPDRAEPHILAWRKQAGRRAAFADPVALADLRVGMAWRATLLPLPGMADRPAPVSGLAVVAGDGMRARYEFVWSRGPSGWRAEDPPDPPTFWESRDKPVGPIALEPVSAIARGMWAESCGRCLRYPLGRRPGTPNISLCRRDCLSTFSAF